ncbi:hypothetical protein ABPG72_007730 [Tetrahymena utriculariae]
MDKHFSPLELQKVIKKNKRRSKKELFVLIQKNMNVVSIFYKEPQQEKKIFIAFDVVLNLELFYQCDNFDETFFFHDLSTWRTPIKIEKKHVNGEFTKDSLGVANIYQNYLNTNTISSASTIDLSQKNQTPLMYYQTSDTKSIENQMGHNFLIEIELDSQSTGLVQFSDVSKIIKSFSSEKANSLATQLNKYQDFVNTCLQEYKIQEKSMKKILPNLQEINMLEKAIQESNIKSLSQAHQIIEEKLKKNQYISYIIKINKNGQQILHKFGYSRDFLDVMGVYNNYESFFMRRGPINPFSQQNRLDRLIAGLFHKAEGFFQQSTNNYSDFYSNEQIHTLDNISFNCDFVIDKIFLNKSDKYYVNAGFLLQIATYQISDDTIERIKRIRLKNGQAKLLKQIDNKDNYQDIHNACETELFLNRYYK